MDGVADERLDRFDECNRFHGYLRFRAVGEMNRADDSIPVGDGYYRDARVPFGDAPALNRSRSWTERPAKSVIVSSR